MNVQSKKPAKRRLKQIKLESDWLPESRKTLRPMSDRFEKRMPTLLDRLREDHGNGPKTKPFDENGTLDALKLFSCTHAGVVARKHLRPPQAADIREHFNKLAIDMERVRQRLSELTNRYEFRYVQEKIVETDMAHGAATVMTSLTVLESVVREARKKPDISKRFDRLDSWERVHRLLNELLSSHDDFSYVWKRIEVSVFEEIIVVTNSLRVLESVIREVCKNVPAGRRGRPHDRALGPGEVELLAELYAESTGCQPGSGKGPFARFVGAVLSALGCNVSDDHIVDVIKAARLPKWKGRGNVGVRPRR